MHDTLSSLVERALTGTQRPLEFYLRENGRLSGARANLELANDVACLLAAFVPRHPKAVRSLIDYFVKNEHNEHKESSNDAAAEFIVLCGIVAAGACAAVEADWQTDTLNILDDYTSSPRRHIREGLVLAYQHLLTAIPEVTGERLITLARKGNYFQQCAVITAVIEPPLSYIPDVLRMGLQIQRIVLERLHNAPFAERKGEDFRTLRRILGYTLSVITVAAPEQGFALMRESATWNDPDITWILRENLRKKRLAKFVEDTKVVTSLLAW